MVSRFSPEVILASPEKAELVDAIKKAQAIHAKLKKVYSALNEPGTPQQTAELINERRALLEELRALSHD